MGERFVYAKQFSKDIWDYLGDMPYMPTRYDRDSLVKVAENDSRNAKRVHIWEYFFRINPDDVGKPHLAEIEALRRYWANSEQTLEATYQQRRNYFLVATFIGLTISLATPYIGLEKYQHWAIPFLLLGSITLIANLVITMTKFKTTRNHYQNEIDKLNMAIGSLKKRIPTPPTDSQVHQWLQEDIERLTRQAIERTGLETRLVKLSEAADNPLCVIGPAELQDKKRIPLPFLAENNRSKHLKARRLVVLPDGRFEDFYGIYHIQFILVADDMLGNYGCFYDFITGISSNEHTSELYYHDTVSLDTRQEYREVTVGSVIIPIENAPTFGLVLKSGHRVEVTFANREYFLKLRRQDGNIHAPFDPKRWVRNPEIIVDNAIRALRLHLRHAHANK